jgi:O-antigen ligase
VLSNVFLLLSAGVLTCCLLLGGGTKAGFLSDVIVQLAAIPLLLAAIWRLSDLSSIRRLHWALAFCLAIVLLPLLQLVPLPPEVWTALPNREPVAAAFELLEKELPWMPVSVSPHATAVSALSLLPPVAVFLAMLSLDDRGRRLTSLVVLAVGILNVVVGLNQIAQGPASPLRFYAYTNPTEAVGFFANRNHLAALLYSVTIVAAAWAIEAVRAFEAGRRARDSRAILSLAAAFTVLVALVAAQAMARSRAGLGLTIVAVAGAFALAFFDRRDTSGFTPGRLLVGTTAFAVMFVSQFALYRIMERFSTDQWEDARIVFARNTIEAAKTYMPFGSGMGTFVPVYGTLEKPEDALLDAYVNRAHNDVIELWLEAGAAGLVLMLLFLAWLGVASWKLWRRAGAGASGIDLLLARGATLIVVLLLAHSFVDYPLRTSAMMAFMAFACGLLVAPPPGAGSGASADRAETARSKPAKRTSTRAPEQPPRSPVPAAPAPSSSSAPSAGAPGEPWGHGIAWPEEWRNPAKPQPPPKTPRTGEPPKKE